MPCPISPDFDFLDATLNLERLPVEELAELRTSEPIHWVDVPGGTGGFADKGYWLVTKHADVKEVSKRNEIFGSSPDGAIPTWPQGMTRDAIDLQKAVLLNMDAPQHTRLRKIISRGFTPRAVGRLEDELRARARKIAETAAADGTGDFVEQVSCELITYAMKMAEERAQNPTEDIVTKLTEADIDGEKLSDDEFGFFVFMLAVAGNE